MRMSVQAYRKYLMEQGVENVYKAIITLKDRDIGDSFYFIYYTIDTVKKEIVARVDTSDRTTSLTIDGCHSNADAAIELGKLFLLVVSHDEETVVSSIKYDILGEDYTFRVSLEDTYTRSYEPIVPSMIETDDIMIFEIHVATNEYTDTFFGGERK